MKLTKLSWESKTKIAIKINKIGDIEIPCYVLEDGKRVIVQRGLYKALGMQVGGTRDKEYKAFGGSARLSSFLDKNNIISLNNSGLDPLLNPIVFTVNITYVKIYFTTLIYDITKKRHHEQYKLIIYQDFSKIWNFYL